MGKQHDEVAGPGPAQRRAQRRHLLLDRLGEHLQTSHHAIAQDYEVNGIKHGGNAAAGVAFGGNLLALGLVLFGGVHGVFDAWDDKLLDFGVFAAIGCILLPIWRIFVDRILLNEADLAKEIYEDRNLNAAYLETVALLGLAGALVFVI